MRKRLLFIAGGGVALLGLAIAAVVAVWLLRSDDPNLLTSPPRGAPRRLAAVPQQPPAKFVGEETLRGLDATAVGTTSDVSGELYLTKDGLYKDLPSVFKVDLRTLKTDEALRDGAIKDRALNTSRFPFAEFKVEAVTGLPTSYVEDVEVQLTLSGTMTIHGVSKPLTFTVKARQL